MSKNELDKCHSPQEGTYLCAFEPVDPQIITCEESVMNHKEDGFCHRINSAKRTRIIRVNEQMFYINNYVNLRIIWGCPAFEKLVDVNGSIWITLDPGCRMRIHNYTFVAPDYLGDFELTPNIVNSVPGLIEFETINPGGCKALITLSVH